VGECGSRHWPPGSGGSGAGSRTTSGAYRIEGSWSAVQRPADRRATEITLTDQGWDEITRASSGHIDLVRRLFFEGLPGELLEPLTVGLESVYDNIIDRGTLPAPAEES
jgi:hypothetical protein